MTSPAGSTEPTAEQRLLALMLTTRVLEAETPEQIDECERNVARALAAAVTAERDKYLRVADELEEGDWLMTIEYEAGMDDAARRIREVAG